MTIFHEMAAIFPFFHNGRCQFSISVDSRKSGDLNFVGEGGGQ